MRTAPSEEVHSTILEPPSIFIASRSEGERRLTSQLWCGAPRSSWRGPSRAVLEATGRQARDASAGREPLSHRPERHWPHVASPSGGAASPPARLPPGRPQVRSPEHSSSAKAECPGRRRGRPRRGWRLAPLGPATGRSPPTSHRPASPILRGPGSEPAAPLRVDTVLCHEVADVVMRRCRGRACFRRCPRWCPRWGAPSSRGVSPLSRRTRRGRGRAGV